MTLYKIDTGEKSYILVILVAEHFQIHTNEKPYILVAALFLDTLIFILVRALYPESSLVLI